MFFQLLFIHLYRPFLKYTRSTSPLPFHVSPRKFCTQAAGAISKLFRLYKRTHGLRQICNIAVYIVHSACNIHLLNLPDKYAKRDFVHGVRHLEEIGECWTCARRTLTILRLCAEKWNIELPEEATASFARTRVRWGSAEPSGSPVTLQTPSQPTVTAMTATTAIAATTITTATTATAATAQPVQQQARQPTNSQATMEQMDSGYTAPLERTPEPTVDRPSSSATFSLLPQPAAGLNREGSRMRPYTHLSQAQQEALQAHQEARRNQHDKPAANPSST